MGQPITVLETTSTSNPAVLRFETNRPLSGMGHERYESPPSELRQRPVDELARRLYAAGGVEKIHINGSVVTVTVGAGRTGAGLGDVIRHLFLHYGETPIVPMTAPTDDADTAPEALADPADAPAAQDAADDAPAPDRPGAEAEPAAEQEIVGIPATGLDVAEVASPAREPTAADPDDIAAAAAPVDQDSEATADAEPVDAGTVDVQPTGDVERPVAEPLVAETAPEEPSVAVGPSGPAQAEIVSADEVAPADTDAAAAPAAGTEPEPAGSPEPDAVGADDTFDAHQPGEAADGPVDPPEPPAT